MENLRPLYFLQLLKLKKIKCHQIFEILPLNRSFRQFYKKIDIVSEMEGDSLKSFKWETVNTNGRVTQN